MTHSDTGCNSAWLDIMLPAYGDGPLLRAAIASVFEQDDPRWRLTVVDDGVEEGRSQGLESWVHAFADERVRYLPNPRRLGINRNFQRCVDQSTGDLVMLLGADDRLLPSFVGRAHEVGARFPEATWIHMGAVIVDQDGQPTVPLVDRVKAWTRPTIDGTRLMEGEPLAASLLHGNWMIFPSCVFRGGPLRRLGFRPGYDIVLDLDLYLRILLDGGAAVLLEDPRLQYRRHSASLSSVGANAGSRFVEEDVYFAEIAAVLEGRGWRRAATAARWHWTSRAHGLTKVPALIRAGGLRAGQAALSRTVAIPRQRSAIGNPASLSIPAQRTAHDEPVIDAAEPGR